MCISVEQIIINIKLEDIQKNIIDLFNESLQYTYKSFNHIDKRYYSRYYNEILSMYNYPNKNKININKRLKSFIISI